MMQVAPGTEPFLHPHVSETLEPALRYDPETIAQQYQARPWTVRRRWLQILLPVLTFWLRWWWARKTGQPPHSQSQAVRLRELLTRLGPAYIKIGQALSTRPDLLPATYLEELVKLQDQLPPFPNELAYHFIEIELGDRPDRLYAELTPDPVAAASLGQVYKGKLPSGEVVAVKVQRPDLQEQTALDLYVLRQMATWAQQRFDQKSDLVAIVDEFGARLFEELDYVQEGQNAEKFARLYGHLPDIYVPRIYWDYTNRRVLTMEWITGTKLTQPDRLQSQGLDVRHLIDVGVQCSLRQLLEHGFFHADPHPGNLLVMPEGKLAYLDFGMMSHIQPAQRYGLINAVVHIVNREFEALVEDYIALEFLSPDVEREPIAAALTTVFNEALQASVSEINFQVVMQQLSELMYEFPFRVPAYYALILRSLLSLEGIAIRNDPDFKVLMVAYPYIAKRLLTDPAPELRRSLTNLLFKDGQFRWNRLERLLSNVRQQSETSFDQVINQVLDFLLSERGEVVRMGLADEVVRAIDSLNEQALYRTIGLFRRTSSQPSAAIDPQMVTVLQRLWLLVQDGSGTNPAHLIQALTIIISKPETHQTGRYIARRLAHRTATRLVAEFFLPRVTPDPAYSHPFHSRQLALPESNSNAS